MKTIIEIIIVIVLIVTLDVIASNFFMGEFQYYNEAIDEIYELVELNKTNEVMEKIEILTDRWHSTNPTWGALTNHMELEKIEVLIHRLNDYNISSNRELAIIDLIELNILIEHTAKRYDLQFENIF